MNPYFRHFLFVGLSAGYAALMLANGSKISLLSRRGGLLLFIGCAWLCCYAKGKRVKSDADPYPYRIVSVWVGLLGMLFCLLRWACFG